MAPGQHTCCCVPELWESSTWHQVLEDQILGEAVLPQNRRYACGFIGKGLLTAVCATLLDFDLRQTTHIDTETQSKGQTSQGVHKDEVMVYLGCSIKILHTAVT